MLLMCTAQNEVFCARDDMDNRTMVLRASDKFDDVQPALNTMQKSNAGWSPTTEQ